MGGKSQEFIVGYNYFFGMHQISCMAPVDGISAIYFDDREAWVGPIGTTAIEVNAPQLFGGREREGGFVGYIDYESGTHKQTANDYLKQALYTGGFSGADAAGAFSTEGYNPALTSGHRGVAGLVFRRPMWGNNPYPKRMRQRWHNIYNTFPASLDPTFYTDDPSEFIFDPWLPEYAAICEETDMHDIAIHIAIDQSSSMDDSAKDPPMRAAVKDFLETLSAGGANIALRIQPFNTTALTAHENLAFDASGLAAAQAYIDALPTPTGTTRFDEGVNSAAQFFTDAETAFYGTASYTDYDPALSGDPGFRVGDAGVATKTNRIVLFLSDGAAFPISTADDAKTVLDAIYGVQVFCYGVTADAELRVIDNTPSDGVPQITWDQGIVNTFLTGPFRTWADLNAAHILRDVLISPSSGGSGVLTEIGDSFATAAATFYAEGMGLSFHHRNPSDRDSFRRLVEEHAGCVTYFDAATGKWEIKLIRPDYDVETLFTFDGDTIVEWLDYERPQQFEVPNHITLIYTRRDNGEKASMSMTNVAAVQVTGRVIPEKVELVGITCPALAAKVLQRELLARSQTIAKGGIRVAYCPTDINLGSAIIVNEPRLGIENMVVRVTEIEETDGKDNSIIIRFAEDVFQYDLQTGGSIVAEDVPTTGTQNTQAQPSTTIFLEEVAYYDQILIRGQSDIDASLVTDPDLGNWQMSGDAYDARHSSAIIVRNDAYVWTQVAQTNLMPVWQILSTLSRAADSTQFAAQVNGREAELRAGQIIQIGTERMRLDSITINAGNGTAIFTVGRGVLDTVPAEHATGSAVMAWYESVGSDLVDYTSAESVTLRILPRAVGNTLNINDTSNQTVTMDSRAIRPYPVGKLQVESSYAPADELTGTVTVSWAHRNRLTQNSLAILDHTDATITPESGISLDLVRRLINVSSGVETIVPVDETVISSPESTTSTTTDLNELLPYAGGTTWYAEIGVKASRGSPAYENWQTPFVRVPYSPYYDPPLAPDEFFGYVAILYRFDEAVSTDDLPTNDGYAAATLAHRDSPTTVDNIGSTVLHYATSADFSATQRGVITTDSPVPSTQYGIADSFGDTTIEGWAYCTTLAIENYLFSTNYSADQAGIEARIDNNGDLIVQIRYSAATTVLDFTTSGGVVSSGAWFHWALVRSGTRDWEFFINGSSVGTDSQSAAGYDANELVIGGRQGYIPSIDLYIDSFRWTVGIARYLFGFTPAEFYAPPPAATGAAAGAATVAGAGQVTIEATGTAAGAATVTGAGTTAGTTEGDGSAAGAATVAGQGRAVIGGAGAAAGAATVAGEGQATGVQEGDGSAAGSATTAGAGEATVAADGSAGGVAATTGAGQITVGGDGSAAGAATVAGIGSAGTSAPEILGSFLFNNDPLGAGVSPSKYPIGETAGGLNRLDGFTEGVETSWVANTTPNSVRVFSNQTDMWARVHWGLNVNDVQGTWKLIDFKDAGGNSVAYLRCASPDQFQLRSSVSGVDTLQASYADTDYPHSYGWYDFDIHIDMASGGGMEVWQYGLLVMSATFDVTDGGNFTEIAQVDVSNIFNNSGSYMQYALANFDSRTLRFDELRPASAGTDTAWTGTYTDIDELGNSFTDVVSSATTGQKEGFVFDDVDTFYTDTSYDVLGVHVSYSAQNTTGNGGVRPFILSAGSYGYGDTEALVSSPTQGFSHFFTTDPHTGAAWTIAGINAMEVGVESTTGSPQGTVEVGSVKVAVVMRVKDDAVEVATTRAIAINKIDANAIEVATVRAIVILKS